MTPVSLGKKDAGSDRWRCRDGKSRVMSREAGLRVQGRLITTKRPERLAGSAVDVANRDFTVNLLSLGSSLRKLLPSVGRSFTMG
jgi:hypothetical protein